MLGSIPAAPSKNPDDSVALALLNLLNKAIKHGVLVPRWSQRARDERDFAFPFFQLDFAPR